MFDQILHTLRLHALGTQEIPCTKGQHILVSQTVRLITLRSQVQILPPQPNKALENTDVFEGFVILRISRKYNSQHMVNTRV